MSRTTFLIPLIACTIGISAFASQNDKKSDKEAARKNFSDRMNQHSVIEITPTPPTQPTSSMEHTVYNNSQHEDRPYQDTQTQHSGMPKQLSYSTPFSSDKDACEPMTHEEKDMFGLLKTSLSNYSDSDLLQREVCSLSIEEFTTLAQKMASRIVREEVKGVREDAGDDFEGVIVSSGIDALGTHQMHSRKAAKAHKALREKVIIFHIEQDSKVLYHRPMGRKAPGDIDEIKFVIEQTQADIELNVAQRLLPTSYHLHILPARYKCALTAVCGFALFGAYTIFASLFCDKKISQHTPAETNDNLHV